MRARSFTIAAVAALAVLGSGCLGDADLSTDDPGSYVVMGLMAENATQEDRETLAAIARGFDGEVQFSDLDSSFTIGGLSAPECEQIRLKLDEHRTELDGDDKFIVEISECIHAEDMDTNDRARILEALRARA